MVTSFARRLLELHSRAALPKDRELGAIPLPTLDFAQASEWDDVEAAYGLLYDNYLRKGLINPQPSGLRYTHYNLLPESATFIAKAGSRVIATFSLLADTKQFGLPMDELYPDELFALRARSLRLGEISGLAVDPEFSPISTNLIMNLVKLLYTYALKLGVTDLVVACHPKHANLYRRLYLFEEMGGIRMYRSVNDAPALAVTLDLTRARERYQTTYDAEDFNLYRFFFSDEVFQCPEAALRARAFSPDVNCRLCELQPAVVTMLEHGAPGLVRRLTGMDTVQIAQCRRDVHWEAPPIFVAA